MTSARYVTRRDVTVGARDVLLPGSLAMPRDAHGAVLFAHGSGSGRASPRNIHVARALNAARLATLLLDLLTPEEALERQNVFDVPLLAQRLAAATGWLADQHETRQLPIGYFGASTGAAAALWAAAENPIHVGAIVSRGGRPDLAAQRLAYVRAPTLLVVGGLDEVVLELNRRALAELRSEAELRVVPGAGHLFEEPGTLDAVSELAAGWFRRYLIRPPA